MVGIIYYCPTGVTNSLDEIFLISLDEKGRCKSLQEWWHKQQKWT
jgi:hypothetical protein